MSTVIAPSTPVRTPASGPAGWFTQTGQVFRRWIVVTVRQAWGPVMSLLQPIIWILLFGQVFASIGALPAFGGEGYLAYLVPGVLMMTVLYSGAWAGTGYIDDMGSGVMDQLLTAPISRSAIVTGQLLQQLLVNLVQSAIVLGIGFLGGARYPGGFGGILLALLAATLLASAFCSMSTAVALRTRNQVALIGLSQIVVLPATFLSTTMMPASLLPDWIAGIATWNPLTWAVEVGRAGLAGAGDAMLVWGRLGLLAAFASLAFAWAVASLRSYRRSI
ncbi:ABC transporter permease [Agromyces protaetiae]|uniref:Transport permease protein n=1 Tax=Agromyces protaetiae TaxID=2509455 RepID=A0A4P6FGA3_9MICO|nr:ABC transporter permease [Agromyces protaetiae]QAY74143.1 ABC transporter permease [Agromyces protaetiae]